MKKVFALVWPMSIRLQLTCWYTGVLAALILGSGAFVYKHLESSLEATLDGALALRVQQISTEVSERDGLIEIEDGTGNIPSSVADTASGPATMLVDVNATSIVRILDIHGNVVRATPVFRFFHLPGVSLTQPLHGQSWEGTVKVKDDEEVRIYSQALVRDGEPYALVQVGESLQSIHTVLQEQAIILLSLVPVVLLLTAFVSMWLAGRAFAPIHRLSETARKIGAGDLQQRVPVPATRDEVHFLALTLNEMIARLDEAFKRQKRFVSDASHELRTPVAAIRSKTDVALLQERTGAEYVGVLQSVNAESERLGLLISDLLALARADEGKIALEREPVQLAFLLVTVAATAEELAQQRGITLVVHAEEEVTIVGDEARLIQMVMNLLDNALTYTSAEGTVTLSVERADNAARIRVQDTGIGIAAEHLPLIFERFYRADPAHQRQEGGSSSGLGLAIVDWIVRAHKGTIQVESQPGQGTAFTVTLPFVASGELPVRFGG